MTKDILDNPEFKEAVKDCVMTIALIAEKAYEEGYSDEYMQGLSFCHGMIKFFEGEDDA